MINTAIIELEKEVIDYAKHIERMLFDAAEGVFERNSGLLEKVLGIEEEKSDDMDLSLYENCVNTIAKFQPVSKNLRIVISIIAMGASLERIGDHCVNIARSGLILNSYKQVIPYIDLPQMKSVTVIMLQKAVSSLINQDINIAKSVLSMDEEVDDYKRKIHKTLQQYMTDKDILTAIVELMNIVNNLERIADLSVNICEDVIYSESGKMKR
ncbi:MAG: phosphate signaling complex protein PhoU [Elusimicrobiota bacterium]|jgi:phosphate transport system protein|nr:phosphate signaling complex protein PhoU [Elusimicrobiota bacterium]